MGNDRTAGGEPFAPPLLSDFEPVSCPLCGSMAASPLVTARDDFTGKPGRFSYVRCQSCGHGYQSPRLKAEPLGRYYDDVRVEVTAAEKGGWTAKAHRWAVEGIERKRFALVRAHLPHALDQTQSVLDLGCGAGRFLRLVRRVTGARVTGVDFKNRSAAAWPGEVTFHQGLFRDADLGEETYDLITFWHSLEHEADPLAALLKARAHLRPGTGRLVVEVPRLDSLTWWLFKAHWPGLQAPQHLSLFTRASLLTALESVGFEVLAHRAHGTIPAYLYIFSGLVFPFTKGRGLNIKRLLVPYFLGQLLALPFGFPARRMNMGMQIAVCRVPDSERGKQRP